LLTENNSGQYKKMKADPNNQFATDGTAPAQVPTTPRARGKRTADGNGESAAKKPRTQKKKVKEEDVVETIEGDNAET
jgi:hypothetical protein